MRFLISLLYIFIMWPSFQVHAEVPGLLPIAVTANTLLATSKVKGIAEVYNQKIAYMLPKGFVAGKDYDDGNAYSVELLPSDYQIIDWKSRIVITGYRGVAEIDHMSASVFAKGLLKISEGCATSWLARDLGARSIEGYDAHAVMTGCGSVRAGEYQGAIPGAGEVHVALIIQGLHEMLTVEFVLRGKNFGAGQAPFPTDIAQRLIDYFNPVALCAASVTTSQCVTRQQEVAQGIK